MPGLRLGTPNAFKGDPYGWLTNQMSHVCAGILGGWLGIRLGVSPAHTFCLGLTLTVGVEAWQARRSFNLADSAEDVCASMSGAWWSLFGGSWWLFALIVVGLALGVRSRS